MKEKKHFHPLSLSMELSTKTNKLSKKTNEGSNKTNKGCN